MKYPVWPDLYFCFLTKYYVTYPFLKNGYSFFHPSFKFYLDETQVFSL